MNVTTRLEHCGHRRRYRVGWILPVYGSNYVFGGQPSAVELEGSARSADSMYFAAGIEDSRSADLFRIPLRDDLSGYVPKGAHPSDAGQAAQLPARSDGNESIVVGLLGG